MDKLYRYYFNNVKEPVEIQAACSRDARNVLRKSMPLLGKKYQDSRRVIGETVTKLLIGASSRIDEKGVKMIWVGLAMTRTGWQSEDELEKAAKRFAEKEDIFILKEKRNNK